MFLARRRTPWPSSNVIVSGMLYIRRTLPNVCMCNVGTLKLYPQTLDGSITKNILRTSWVEEPRRSHNEWWSQNNLLYCNISRFSVRSDAKDACSRTFSQVQCTQHVEVWLTWTATLLSREIQSVLMEVRVDVCLRFQNDALKRTKWASRLRISPNHNGSIGLPQNTWLTNNK